jgi:cyclic lactone autoinducer peptide
MKKIVAMLMLALGLVASTAASTGCMIVLVDEPEMPASMIN